MDQQEIKHFVEAALLAAGRPLNVGQIKDLFDERMAPEKAEIRQAIAELNDEYAERGILITEVASGFRMQVRTAMAERLHKLWEERPPRYSRALFETLALIAYRQPITRGEIEEIRGVSVSSNIVRQLLERDWVRVVGHRDVPGRPEMFGTTKGFLDYFSLKKLDDLPPLADLADWESLRVQLNLPEVESSGEADVPVSTVPAAVNDESAADSDDGVESEAPQAETNDDESSAAEDDAEPVNLARRLTVEGSSTELPVLYPEDDQESDAPAEDELVISEWPKPVG